MSPLLLPLCFLAALGIALWAILHGGDVDDSVAFSTRAIAIEDAKCHGKARSPHWPAVRKAFLAEHPTCEACGGAENLEAHHVKMFHVHPDLELDPKNLICLCEHPVRECHYHYGHNSLSWSSCNPHVREDAPTFLERRAHPSTA